MQIAEEHGQVDVLLVEDNPSDAEFALRALGKAATTPRVGHVQDGAEALDFLFALGKYEGRKAMPLPKVVLLDLKMPKIGGIEVLRRLKANARLRHLPVVILTSSNEQRDLVECYASGVNSYVVKPVNYESFSRLLVDLYRYWVEINQAPKALEASN